MASIKSRFESYGLLNLVHLGDKSLCKVTFKCLSSEEVSSPWVGKNSTGYPTSRRWGIPRTFKEGSLSKRRLHWVVTFAISTFWRYLDSIFMNVKISSNIIRVKTKSKVDFCSKATQHFHFLCDHCQQSLPMLILLPLVVTLFVLRNNTECTSWSSHAFSDIN